MVNIAFVIYYFAIFNVFTHSDYSFAVKKKYDKALYNVFRINLKQYILSTESLARYF